ncbi:VOC family protein [Paenibacillus antri]|uniref:VOC family protein n=1 Tax=Paenibacillus antri TaxID=2582848 RepID=A0A5R9GBW5_9BACL|nr:VOC family protein [Paenibacillus antri]TLS50878.1 VOC family protein [Paenibacillus antri]
MTTTIRKITPNLWFDGQAEEAANHYISIFKNGSIERIARVGEDRDVLTVEFELEGQRFVALNGGPHFRFNEAISFIVHCDTQEEADYYWDRLSEGGDEKAQVCGWLKDKFGVSWQIVPSDLTDMVTDSDPAKAERVMKAIRATAKKLDFAALRRAYAGE